jgi:hypothetical protein
MDPEGPLGQANSSGVLPQWASKTKARAASIGPAHRFNLFIDLSFFRFTTGECASLKQNCAA